MKQRSYQIAREALARGSNVVIDNTNLSKRVVEHWTQLGHAAGATVRIQRFETPVEECVKRDALRTGRHHVGRYVIERMALMNNRITFAPHEKLILVDMDGTLSDCEHRRHFVTQKPKDWEGFHGHCLEDPPNDMVYQFVQAMAKQPDYVVCVVSGRPMDMAGAKTEEWLKLHGVQYRHLFMRNGMDFREDTVVKQEILDRLPKDQIAFVLDDRPSVVRMWRANGLQAIACADQAVEF